MPYNTPRSQHMLAALMLGLLLIWMSVVGSSVFAAATTPTMKATAVSAMATMPIERVITQTAVIENLGGRLIFADMEVINGRPTMVYFNYSTNQLMFKRAADTNGDNWLDPVAIYQTPVFASALALGEINGKPAVAFNDNNSRTVFYIQAADSTGSSWGTAVPIDTLPLVGGESIDMDTVNGVPALTYTAYTQSNVNELRYARANDANGTSWSVPQTVDNSSTRTGWFSQLEIVDGFPAIAYQDLTLGNLMFVRALDAIGSSWATPQIIDAAGTSGQWPSMTIVDNNPAIAYRYSGIIRYVRASAADGSSWTTPVDLGAMTTVGSGGPHLTVVNGQPALLYFNAGTLLYQHANNTTGSSWARPTTVYTTTNENLRYLSLEAVNGRPAIGAFNAAPETIVYQRANDANGTLWGTFQRLDGGYSGDHNALALVNGRPAVSFAQSIGGGLRYARALDSSGSGWAEAAVVDTARGAGEQSQLMVVNNRPTITYLDNGPALRFVRAADLDGNSWLSPTVLVTGTIYTHAAAVVDGRPAIAYYDFTAGELRFIRAADQDGISWGTPVVITNSIEPDSAAGQIALFTLNGNPAVAIIDTNSSTLNLIRANDTVGSSWGTPSLVSTAYPWEGFGFDFHAGRLAFVYYEEDLVNNNYPVRYLRAVDANATSWEEPVTVATLDNVRDRVFLGWLNGRPAAAFSIRNTTTDWLLVRATDAAGSSWDAPTVLLPETGYASLLQIDDQKLGFAEGSQALNYLYYAVENQYEVVVAKTGSGAGLVTSIPTGIACGITCTAPFTVGTAVTLTAVADTGSTFTGWDGACTGEADCTLVINAAQQVTATFALNYALTISVTGTGLGRVTSDPPGIVCATLCSDDFVDGTVVTLTATAADNARFVGWSGACSGTDPCTVTMTAAQNVQAEFVEVSSVFLPVVVRP